MFGQVIYNPLFAVFQCFKHIHDERVAYFSEAAAMTTGSAFPPFKVW